MYIYLLVFALSCISIAIGNKKSTKNKTLFILVGILLPCILAGLRKYTIGTDVNVYIKPMFELALKSNNFNEFLHGQWFHIWTFKTPTEFEIGFVLLVYILSKLFSNLQIILFIIQALISFPIYKAIKKYNALKGKEWFCMLIYYLLFFNIGLNVTRQYISIAILFYAFSCLINENKHVKFFILMIISTLFHKSALLGLILYILYLCFSKKYLGKYHIPIKSKKIPVPLFFIIIFSIISIFLILNTSFISTILDVLGFDKYIGYIDGNVKLRIKSIIKILPIIILFILSIKTYLKQKNSYIYTFIYLASFFLSQFATASEYGGRISYTFDIFNIIFFTLLCYSKKKYRRIKILCVTIYMLFYWYYYFVFTCSNETIPYIFYFN